MLEISFDPAKRAATLLKRGLDFSDAGVVFASETVEWADERFDYGELRMVTAGWLEGRMVILVWTPRGQARHIISMGKANDREQANLGEQFTEGRRV